MKSSKLIIILLLGLTRVYAQGEKCFAEKATEKLMQKYPQYALELQQAQHDRESGNYLYGSGKRATLYTIPVVVHVIYANTVQNVTNAAIYSQINTMNNDFRRFNADASVTRPMFLPVADDVEIEFCLASIDPSGNPTNGITRTSTTKTEWDYETEGDDMKFTSKGGIDAWDPYHYLNVWIVNLNSGSGIAGYAYIGSFFTHGRDEDGIVLDYQTGFGPSDRSLTHEAGHYLGLRHIWGNDESCSSDDGFSDTPNSDGPNFVGCNSNPVSCGTQDQFENYMDYSNCSNMYTIQQANFMRNLLSVSRNSLLNSQACGSIPVANFRTANQTICVGGTISFEDNTIYNPSSWQWNFPGGTPSQSTSKNPVVTYTTAGTYSATLIATNSNGNDTTVKNGFVRVNTIPVATVSVTNAVCDEANGAIILTVIGGSSPYVFLWSDSFTTQNRANIPAATYSVTVTDKFNCTAFSSVVIAEESDLQIISVTEPDSAGSGKGMASVGLTGGTPPYTYQWNDPQQSTSSNLTGLIAGTYTVTATDAGGCRLVKTFSIGDIAPLTGINLSESVKFFEVFPNPASEVLNVSLSFVHPLNIQLGFYNAEGKVMMQQFFTGMEKSHLQLPVNHLPGGVYYLKVNASESSLVKKVVLVR